MYIQPSVLLTHTSMKWCPQLLITDITVCLETYQVVNHVEVITSRGNVQRSHPLTITQVYVNIYNKIQQFCHNDFRDCPPFHSHVYNIHNTKYIEVYFQILVISAWNYISSKKTKNHNAPFNNTQKQYCDQNLIEGCEDLIITCCYKTVCLVDGS